VVKNGSRLCGTGCARATTPILQNKAYWEIKLQQSGIWSCGVGPSIINSTCSKRFEDLGQAKFAYGCSILGSSQFTLLPQLPLKTMLLSLKVVKIDSKILSFLH